MGTFAPRTDRQMISLSVCSSAASASRKSIFADSAAPQLSGAFRSLMSTWAATWTNGVRSALAWNESYIGRAAASNWVIGFRPKISSIVRNMLDVEYMLESTACRFV